MRKRGWCNFLEKSKASQQQQQKQLPLDDVPRRHSVPHLSSSSSSFNRDNFLALIMFFSWLPILPLLPAQGTYVQVIWSCDHHCIQEKHLTHSAIIILLAREPQDFSSSFKYLPTYIIDSNVLQLAYNNNKKNPDDDDTRKRRYGRSS
jgi:hypothetical protein